MFLKWLRCLTELVDLVPGLYQGKVVGLLAKALSSPPSS